MHAMVWLVFGSLALIYTLICAYYWSRFLRPTERGGRKYQSALSGVLPLGWVVAVAMKLRVMPLWLENSMLAIAYTVGGLVAAIIVLRELQKDRPFR